MWRAGAVVGGLVLLAAEADAIKPLISIMGVGLPSIRAAAKRLAGVALLTPILRSDAIDKLARCSVHFKSEHLQRTGSFKFRGACNAVFALDDEAAARGVVAHSSGNHGAAVSAAAQARGVPCTIIVPDTTPLAKQENIKRYGAELVLCAPTQQARTETSNAIAERDGAALVHPYNDELVAAGQGTIGLELLEQVPSLDAILVPVSGGGLIGGIAAAAKAIKPSIRMIACEPAGKRLGEALQADERVIDASIADAALDTICDAIRTQPLGPIPWALARELVDSRVLSADDAMVRAALCLTMSELKQAVEPAGAIALACLLSPEFGELQREAEAEGTPLREVGVVVCGGNADLAGLAEQVHLHLAEVDATRTDSSPS